MIRSKHLPYLSISLFSLLLSCVQNKSKKEYDADVSLIDPVYINANFVDSALIEHTASHYTFLKTKEQELHSFYKKRNYQCAWFNNSGLIEQASLFINQLQSTHLELSDSINGFHQILQWYADFETDSMSVLHRKQFDILMTYAFFDFAEKKWGGMQENKSKEIGWYIKRKRLLYADLLDSLLTDADFFAHHKPNNKQYELLRQFLVRYKALEAQGGLPYIDTVKRAYRKGDTSFVVKNIRLWLYKTGYLLNADTVKIKFDDTLMLSVKQLQQSFGLEEDGVVGKELIKRMNVPLQERIKQILINMERFRWIENADTGRHILINIPRFTLYAYRNDTLDWQCKVVVGTTQNKTTIFNGNIRYIVLNPYWNVPNSILFNEVLPAYRKDKNYFKKHQMEIIGPGNKIVSPEDVNWNKYNQSNFPYMVRQLPGNDNPLGAVKFLFPNSYNIYLHDSPAKQYFDKNKRTFSHGCIRVSEPMVLMQWLLLHEKNITPDKVKKIKESGKETYITLQKSIPVMIAYFTAWVDEAGKLQFADDVYGHDKVMKQIMFKDEAQAL
jgi:murein L,D-transpeptidase YcbB/YkuD